MRRPVRKLWPVATMGVALLAAAVLLVGSPAAPPQPSTSDGPVPTESGWPSAKPWQIPAGQGVEPILPVSSGTAIVQHTDAAGSSRLVVYRADEPKRLRPLMDLPADTTVPAVAVDAARVFWMTRSGNADVPSRVAVHSAPLDGPDEPARLLVADAGTVRFTGASFDLQVAAGRLRWVTEAGGSSELRSSTLDGADVRVRRFDGTVAPLRWPWVSIGTGARVAELRNVETEQTVAVQHDGPDRIDCSPVWCRTRADSQLGVTMALIRPDGGDRRLLPAADALAAADVAVLDRFEILVTGRAPGRLLAFVNLLVYDIERRTRISLGTVSTWGSHGSWLWWATGSLNDPTWHLLDLRTVR